MTDKTKAQNLKKAQALFAEFADRAAEVLISKLFSGRRANNAELHLSRQDIRCIVAAAFLSGADLGFEAGLTINDTTNDTKETT